MFIRFRQAKPERGLNAARLVVDFQHYFAEKIEARKSCPTDDVLSDIVNASADGETPMNIEECLSVISQLLVAGNETTTSTFAEGMHLLASHPEELKKVQDDPSLVPNMVEEMLRLSTPTAQMWRIAKEDCEVGGVTIPKGATMMVKFHQLTEMKPSSLTPTPLRSTGRTSNLKLPSAKGCTIAWGTACTTGADGGLQSHS